MSDKFKIYVDANGAEISRSPMTKGRAPAGATKDADGNWVCPPKAEKQVETVSYITIETNGTVIRETKGRGRTRAGYTLATEGEHAGNWVKVLTAEVEVAEAVAV